MDGQGPGDVRSNEELTRATGAGLRWVTYTRIAIEVVTLASMVVLARLIPPAGFGVFAVVVIVQELALSVPSEGVGGALVQRRNIVRAHLQAGLALSLGLGAALSALTLILAEVLIRPLYGDGTADLVLLAIPCFLLGALTVVPAAILRRGLDFARLSMIEVVSAVTRTATTVALAIAGLDASALVLGYMAGQVASLGLALAFARPPLPRWRRREIGELLPYGGPATCASFAWAGFRNGDYAIISAQLGPAQAGFYWRAYQLGVEYQKKVSIVMSQMAFPVLARAAGTDEMLALRRRMVRTLTVILFPLLALLVVLAPVLVPWLFGPAWEPAVLPTQILAAGGATTLVIDAVGPALMAAGRSKALLGYGVGHFVVYAGAVVVVASHGLAAVAAAAAVVHAVFLLVAYQVLLGGRGWLALRTLCTDVAAASVSCLALAAVAAPLAIALDGAGAPVLARLAAVSAAGGVAYLVVLRFGFPAAFADLAAVVRRVLPWRALITQVPGGGSRWSRRTPAKELVTWRSR